MTTLRDGHDLALRVMQYAEFHDLDLIAVNIRADEVSATCDNFDHAKRLAAGFDLWRSDARRHVHGRQVYLHSQWSGDGLMVVVNASLMEPVGVAS